MASHDRPVQSGIRRGRDKHDRAVHSAVQIEVFQHLLRRDARPLQGKECGTRYGRSVRSPCDEAYLRAPRARQDRNALGRRLHGSRGACEGEHLSLGRDRAQLVLSQGRARLARLGVQRHGISEHLLPRHVLVEPLHRECGRGDRQHRKLCRTREEERRSRNPQHELGRFRTHMPVQLESVRCAVRSAEELEHGCRNGRRFHAPCIGEALRGRRIRHDGDDSCALPRREHLDVGASCDVVQQEFPHGRDRGVHLRKRKDRR